MNTTYYNTGPPLEGHATPLPGQGAKIGVVRRTRHTRREINRIPSVAQRSPGVPANSSAYFHPSVHSSQDDLKRRAQLEAIAQDEHASADSRESARADLWSEFAPNSPMNPRNPHELPEPTP